MKMLYVVLIVMQAGMLYAAAKTPNPNKYKNINIDVILRNPKIVNNYIMCLLDRKPCTAEGRDLKVIVPNAIKSECRECTDQQKKAIEKVFKYMSEKRPEDWKKLLEKFDPEKIHRKKLEKTFKFSAATASAGAAATAL